MNIPIITLIFVKLVKPKLNFFIALGIVTPWGGDLRQSCVAVYWSKAPFYEVGRERCEPGQPIKYSPTHASGERLY